MDAARLEQYYRLPVLAGAGRRSNTFAAHPFSRVIETWSRVLDLTLAALLAVIVIFTAATGQQGQPLGGTVLLLVGAVAVAWRHRWPIAVLAITLFTYLGDHLLTQHTGPGQPAVLIALYTLAAQEAARVAIGATLAAAVVTAVAQSAHGIPHGTGLAVSIGAVVASGLIGIGVAERRRERTRERQLLTNNAAAEERVRIARELHDVVAHHLSVMVVQANVIAEAIPPDSHAHIPARAIVDSGRQALAEMRRILGVLRVHDHADLERGGLQPGLAQLSALVQTVTRAGIQVDVRIDGSERPLPGALDLSAYRIVQEALTNILRHAHAANARVRITYAPTALELQINDDGVGPPRDAERAQGHGLAGMRERVAMFGGEVSCGPANGRGYAVHAVLPL